MKNEKTDEKDRRTQERVRMKRMTEKTRNERMTEKK
jgi:hypothetical protein